MQFLHFLNHSKGHSSPRLLVKALKARQDSSGNCMCISVYSIKVFAVFILSRGGFAVH